MAFNKQKALKAADKHISKQNYNKALTELLKVVKQTPNDYNLLNKVGDLYSKVGNTKSAVEYFTKVAESYSKGGFNLKAIALYKKIVRIDDTALDARQRLVDLYVQQGHHTEAKAELRRMGEHFYEESLFLRALDCYQRLVEIEPHNLDARLKIAELLIKEGKREKAIEHFAAMGRELLSKTMVNEARKVLSQGLNILPDNLELQILTARCLLTEGKVDEALGMLTDICRNNPDNLEALRILGETYLKKGALNESKAVFLRAFSISNTENGMLEEVGNRLIKEGRLDDAFACMEPLGAYFVGRGEYDEAVRLFRGILYQNENHLPSLERLVDIYKTAGQKPNAMLTLEKIIGFKMEQGDRDSAMETIQTLLKLDPNNIEWQDKLARLQGRGRQPQPPSPSRHVEPSAPKIQVFDEGPPPTETVDSASMDDLTGLEVEDSLVEDFDASLTGGALEESETSKVQNHLTEADVLIKYGVMDQAMTHLLEAQNLDPLNIEANERLRDIYLKQGDVQSAVLCMVRLINANVEKQDYTAAQSHIREIEGHRPDIAAQHRDRLQNLMRENSESFEAPPSSGSGFSLDFDDAPEGDLKITAPDASDVVDFRDMNAGADQGFNLGDAPAADDGGGWELDMPASDISGDGLGEEFNELYNPASQTLSEGADELPDLDQIRAGFEAVAPKAHAVDEEEHNTEDFTEKIGEITGPRDFDPMDAGSDVISIGEDAPITGVFEAESEAFAESMAAAESNLDLGDGDLVGDIAFDAPVEAPTAPAPVDEAPIGLDDSLPEAELLDMDEEAMELGDEDIIDDEPAVPEAPLEPEPVAAAQSLDPTESTGFGFLELEDAEAEPEPLPEPELEPAPVAKSPEPQHVPLESAHGSLTGELEEIDFFISVEAFDDALSLIETAREHFGDHPLLMERLQEVTAKTQDRPENAASAFKPGDTLDGDPGDSLLGDGGSGFFDLAAELSEELLEEEDVDVNDKTSQEEIQSVEELFQEFKKGVDEQIDANDTETHYDLGIAYKEMGLLEEAVSEFERANQDPNRFLDCATMMGHCYIELGRLDQAAEHFQAAAEKAQSQDQLVALKYELALVQENLGQVENALALLQEIQQLTPEYRDIAERIEALAI